MKNNYKEKLSITEQSNIKMNQQFGYPKYVGVTIFNDGSIECNTNYVDTPPCLKYVDSRCYDELVDVFKSIINCKISDPIKYIQKVDEMVIDAYEKAKDISNEHTNKV